MLLSAALAAATAPASLAAAEGGDFLANMAVVDPRAGAAGAGASRGSQDNLADPDESADDDCADDGRCADDCADECADVGHPQTPVDRHGAAEEPALDPQLAAAAKAGAELEVARIALHACNHTWSCAPHGACIGRVCVCADGYSGPVCRDSPDPCMWPATVRCGPSAHCVAGTCERVDWCAALLYFFWRSAPCEGELPCGSHGRCAEGHCICEQGWSGADKPGECSDADECASSPCRNGGSCFHSADVQAQDGPSHAQLQERWVGRHVCACAQGFAGAECQCLHCGDHGSCQFDGRCVCEAGFVGAQCEINVDECASKPCVNGATCNDLDFAYTCSCVAGYDGEHCASDVNECGSSPCGSHGSCVDEVGVYSCRCEDGWSGEHCDSSPPCVSAPCLNGGACSDVVDKKTGEPAYKCKCVTGWLGVDCGFHGCDASPPACANGGKCKAVAAAADPRGFQCECADGYSGPACTTQPDPCMWPTVLECGRQGRCQPDAGAQGGCACECSGGYR